MSTTAGYDRPFAAPPHYPAPDDRAPAPALDLARATDLLERICKAVEKLARHEHVPWSTAETVTVQPGATFTLDRQKNITGFVVVNTTGQTLFARLGGFCSSTDFDVIVPNNHVCRYEQRDWEGSQLTFFNNSGGAVTFQVLVGRPVPELTLVAV